jgi:hypothetical protein
MYKFISEDLRAQRSVVIGEAIARLLALLDAEIGLFQR